MLGFFPLQIFTFCFKEMGKKHFLHIMQLHLMEYYKCFQILQHKGYCCSKVPEKIKTVCSLMYLMAPPPTQQCLELPQHLHIQVTWTVLMAIWRGEQRSWKGILGWLCWMDFCEGMKKLLLRIVKRLVAQACLGSQIIQQ